MKEYITHYNHVDFFKVIIDKNNVKVFTIDNNLLSNEIVSEIFIGHSDYNKMTSFSNGFGQNYDGNTILLNIENNRYKFIGKYIFTFESINKIIAFVSPIGNNCVPYPYAIDTNGNIYLLYENVIIKKCQNCEPYEYYYKNRKINYSYFINNEEYSLTYYPDPEKHFKDGEIHSIIKDGNIRNLTKEEYCRIHERHGVINNFRRII